jgi:hypothetical protein
MLIHDGRFVAELALRASEPGSGKARPLQSGARPNWRHTPTGRVLEGPVTLTDDARSVRPGETGTVEIHPIRPQDWAGISEGAELELLSARGTVIGTARILQVLGMPDSAAVDLSWVDPPTPPGSNWLAR